jgi:hypothetical protein
MDLEKKLNDLGQHINNRYPEINHGGCCVFAAMVARELHSKGIQAQGIVASGCAAKEAGNITIDAARELVEWNTVWQWESNGVSFSHVGVEFRLGRKIKHYDTNGVHKISKELDGLPIYKGRLTLKEMEDLARCKDGWNDSFNRRHIPAIRREVKKFLKDVTMVD